MAPWGCSQEEARNQTTATPMSRKIPKVAPTATRGSASEHSFATRTTTTRTTRTETNEDDCIDGSSRWSVSRNTQFRGIWSVCMMVMVVLVGPMGPRWCAMAAIAAEDPVAGQCRVGSSSEFPGSAPSTVKVVVVGGGISGLAATRALLRARTGMAQQLEEAAKGTHKPLRPCFDLKVDLLEAKPDRLGGRLWTTTTEKNGSPIDLGGMYWHGIDSPLFQTLRSELAPSNWTTVPTQGNSANPGKGGARWVFFHGNQTSSTLDPDTVNTELPGLLKRWNATIQARVREHLEKEDQVTRKKPDLLKEWSEAFLKTLHTERERRLLRFQLRMAFDLDTGIPMEYHSFPGFSTNFDWRDLPGDDHVSLGGMSTLVEALSQDIESFRPPEGSFRRGVGGAVHLGQRVIRIEHSNADPEAPSSCKVETELGKVFEADYCIITLPIGVLKEKHGGLFVPPLDSSKKDAIERTGVGHLNTVAVQWKRPVCTDRNTTAYYLLQHPGNKNTAPLNNNPLAHGFICSGLLRSDDPTITQFHLSDPSLPLSPGNEAYWESKALEVIHGLFPEGNFSKADVSGVVWSAWHLDPDVRGSYSAPTTLMRGNPDRSALARPLTSLHFAGEHTHASGRYQSLDGALETGLRAAGEVLNKVLAECLARKREVAASA